MSGVLFRSVAKLYVLLAASMLAGVVVIYLVADFGDWVRIYVNRPWTDVGLLYWFKAQVAVQQFAPAALLLAGGAAVTVLRRRGEWTAMQALGFSRWAMVAPVLASAGLAALVLVAFDDRVVTTAGTRIDELMVQRFGRVGDTGVFYAPKRWFRVGRHVVHLMGEAPREGPLTEVSVFELGPQFELQRRLEAARMFSVGGGRWRLEGVSERRFGEGSAAPVVKADEVLELEGTTPDTFRIQVGRPELMPFGELLEQERLRAKVGLTSGRFWYAFHSRLAYPVTGVAGALLAALLALRPSRKGALALALVEGAGISFGLFTVTLAGKALVLGEHAPAWGAAWAPVVGLVVAAVMVWLASEGRFGLRRAAR